MKRLFFILLALGTGNVGAQGTPRPTPSPLTVELSQAVQEGPAQRVWELLRRGAPVNGRDRNGRTPLITALEGNPSVVQMLLEAGADPNARDKFGQVPLALAFADARTLPLLLRFGARVEGQAGVAAFISAAQRGDLTGMKMLHGHGIAVDARGAWIEQWGETALSAGVERQQKEVVRWLLDNGAHADKPDSHGQTVLFYFSEANAPLVSLLLERGADPKARNLQGQTPLHRAGSAEVAQVLLDAGADPNARDRSGETPLFRTQDDSYDAPVARLLLQHGAQVNVRNAKGETPLDVAINKRAANLVRVLLENGADGPSDEAVTRAASLIDLATVMALLHAPHLSPDARQKLERAGWSGALMNAFAADDLERALASLDAGADVNARDAYGNTVLSQAMGLKTALFSWVRALLERGADPNGASNNASYSSITPLQLGRRDPSLMQLLLDHGARIDGRNLRGETALMEAARDSQLDLRTVRFLLARGADPNARDNEGHSCAHFLFGLGFYAFWPWPNLEAVRVFQDAHTDWNAQDKIGKTALMQAAASKNAPAARLLLLFGAKPNLRDQGGQTALMWACQAFAPFTAPSSGSLGSSFILPDAPIMHALLEGGADLNAQDNLGFSPLIRLAQYNPEELDGPTLYALNVAISDDKLRRQQRQQWVNECRVQVTKVARVLLESGANPRLATRNGNTALSWAQDRGNEPLVRLLQNALNPRARTNSSSRAPIRPSARTLPNPANHRAN